MSITVTNLSKNYGAQKVVNNISFTINKGEIVGFLGPNGAGKTTTLEIIETLREKTSSDVTVAGMNIEKHANAIKPAPEVISFVKLPTAPNVKYDPPIPATKPASSTFL